VEVSFFLHSVHCFKLFCINFSVVQLLLLVSSILRCHHSSSLLNIFLCWWKRLYKRSNSTNFCLIFNFRWTAMRAATEPHILLISCHVASLPRQQLENESNKLLLTKFSNIVRLSWVNQVLLAWSHVLPSNINMAMARLTRATTLHSNYVHLNKQQHRLFF